MAFFVFEGGEGVGKSTQVARVAEALRRGGHRVTTTREPGGTPLAESIRELFKRKGETPLPVTELLLVMAARAEHVARVIRPCLEAGEVVISDRFLDSSFVYQHYVGGVPRALVESVGLAAVGALVPDVTFVFDADESVLAARKNALSTQERADDRYDSAGATLHARLALGFRRLLEDEPPYPSGVVPLRVRIDASRTPEAIESELLTLMTPFLHARGAKP